MDVYGKVDRMGVKVVESGINLDYLLNFQDIWLGLCYNRRRDLGVVLCCSNYPKCKFTKK